MMLQTIVFLLKLLGMILGIVLGFLILLVLLLLFVPIRYRLRVTSEAGKISGKAGADWLLHAFGVAAEYFEGQVRIRLKIFWMPLFCLYPPKDKKKNLRKAEQTKTVSAVKKQESKAVDFQEDRRPEEQREDDCTGGYEEGRKADEHGEKYREDDREKDSFNIRKSRRNGRKKRRTEKVTYTFRRLCDKIDQAVAFLKEGKDFLRREETKAAFEKCRRLLRHIAPRKLGGEIMAGAEDPSLTGELYGVYCMACPLHHFRIHVVPVFDKNVFQGEVFLRGRVCIATVLYYALQLWRDRNLREFIQNVRNRQGGK